MRILYLITRAEPGGAQVHVLELLRAFRDRAELHLGVGEDWDGFLIQEAGKLGVAVHVVPDLLRPLHPLRDLRALWEVVGLLRRVRPHLVHAHTSKAGFLGRLAARAVGIRSLFTAHGWAFAEGVPEGQRRLALLLERWAGRWGDGVIAVSEADRALALRYGVLPPEKVVVVHNGVPDTPYRANPRGEPPRMVMVARFAPPKDHALLLRALHRLKGLPWTLDLVGDGPLLEKVKALAGNLGLADRVRFLGARRDVDRVLAEAQVFVLASRWEGLPLSVLEAMRAGLPVVATEVGGVGEAVVEGVTGFLVPRGDEEALSQKLRLLLQDPRLREQMGRAGRKRYEEAFTLEETVRATWDVYRELLGVP